MKNLLFLVALCAPVWLCAQSANSLVKAATYSYIRLQNPYAHRVKLTLTDESGNYLTNEAREPGEYVSVSPKKQFKKRKVRRYAVKATYPEELYRKDVRDQEAQYERTLVALAQMEQRKNNLLIEEFAIRLTAELASSTRGDDFASGVVRALGELTKFAYNLRDFAVTVDEIYYMRWDEAADYLANKVANEVALEAINSAMKQAGITDGDNPSKEVLQLAVNYAVALTDVQKDFERERARQMQMNWQALEELERNYQNFRTTSKDFQNITFVKKPFNGHVELVIYPLHYGNPLNADWDANNEPLYTDEMPEDENYGNGWLLNNNFAADARVAVSPVFKFIGSNRLYLGAGYAVNSYDYLGKQGVIVPTSFFSETQSGSFGRTGPFTYELQQITGELTYRILMGKAAFLDFHGAYGTQRGNLSFRYVELEEGWKWADEHPRATESEYQLSYGATLGLGNQRNKRGFHFVAGVRTFTTDLSMSPDWTFKNQTTDQPVSITPDDNFRYRVRIGLLLRL